MATKICSKCRQEKPLEAFCSDTTRMDGRGYVCRQCQQIFRAAHPEKIRARRKTYCATHQQEIAAANAVWRATHPEEQRQYQALYRYAHPEKSRAKRNKYRIAHPGVIKAKGERRRARLRALPETWTETQRQFMLSYWHYACAICGNEEGLYWTLSYDHFIPLASADCPGTVAENMLPLCHTRHGSPLGTPCCNNSKGSKDPHAWLVSRFGTRKAAKIEQAIAVYFSLAAQQR